MIDRTPLHRPRVSRETRQLLFTALAALTALWILARIRFPDAASGSPVPALLTQLAPRATLGEIARESATVRARLGVSLIAGPSGPAFRVREDTALTWSPPADAASPNADKADGGHDEVGHAGGGVITRDRATGLTLLRVPAAASALGPAMWAEDQPDEPRYMLTTAVGPADVALRPTFVASLTPASDPAWPGGIWLVPAETDLQPGALVFTTDAELAGLVVPHPGGMAIVPGATLLAEVSRLLASAARPPATLGIEVQSLTPSVARATGARTGVVLSWVDPSGPSARDLQVGDVIEAVDGRWLDSRRHWDVRAGRLAPGDAVVLGVRRRGEWRDVQLAAAAAATPSGRRPFGATLRALPGVGVEVVSVARSSAADAAGLQPGDIITLAGAIEAPTPAQVRSAYSEIRAGEALLVAATRNRRGRVTALQP